VHKDATRGLALSYIAGALSVVLALFAWRGTRTAAQTELCHGYRWAVKTAYDTGAATVDRTPRDATVASLATLVAPASPPADGRANAIERTTFELRNVRLTTVLRESDGDYHFVVENAAKQTMIAEIPDPDCSKFSRLLPQIEAARAAADAQFGGTFKRIHTDMTVSVRGIGFLDFYHHQPGQARNGIELHPVTALCFGRNCTPAHGERL
jgi:hypothetical protein